MRNTFAITAALLVLAAVPSVAQQSAAQSSATMQQSVAQPSTHLPEAAPATMAHGAMDGRSAAESVGTAGWMAGGFVSGVALGLIGTGIVWAVAASSDTSIPPAQVVLVQPKGPEYVQGYQDAYRHRVRAKRQSSALVGGLAGTATILVLFLSATGG